MSAAPMTTQAPPPRIRGTVIAQGLQWIRKSYGEDLFARALSKLPEEERGPLRGTIITSAWYSIPMWMRFMDACYEEVHALTGEDRDTFDWRGLREGGGRILTTIYKFVFSMFQPTTTLPRMVFVFSRVFDQGKSELLENVP